MGLETLAIIAIASTVVGTGVSGYASYEAGKATDRLHKFNAEQREIEALTSERDGRVLANAQRAANAKVLSRQRALYAKSGVVLEGTPLLVQAQTAGDLEKEALDIERVNNLDARRHSAGATQDLMSGKAARRAGNIGAVGGILQGVGSAASMGAQFKHSGII